MSLIMVLKKEETIKVKTKQNKLKKQTNKQNTLFGAARLPVDALNVTGDYYFDTIRYKMNTWGVQ